MLSATNTLNDMKARLLKTFDFYDFADVPAFNASLTIGVEEAELLDVVPIIGTQWYNEIAALDKVGLTVNQNYIYWAEVHFAMSRFVKTVDEAKVQSVAGSSHSKGVGDVSESITGGTKQSGRAASAGAYYRKAMEYVVQAGYDPMRLARSGTPTREEYNVDARYGSG